MDAYKMKNTARLLLLTIFALALNCHYISGNKTRANNFSAPVMDIYSKLDIVQLLGKYDKTKFHIPYDMEAKKEKTYLGVKTKVVFIDLVKQFRIDPAGYNMIFFCKDGYSPSVPLGQLLDDNGYLAVADFEAKGNWEDKFPPAYLVWDITEDDHHYAFPYGIVSVQLVEKKTEYLLATPKTKDEAIMQGFFLFKEKCIKCHAINQEGGEFGPELNYHKSVTEYWKIDQLKLFIKNPTDFRQNTKMPLVELSAPQIALIVDYLAFMATQKL